MQIEQKLVDAKKRIIPNMLPLFDALVSFFPPHTYATRTQMFHDMSGRFTVIYHMANAGHELILHSALR